MNSSEQRHKLGIVAELMYKSDLYCGYPIACLKLWIEPAILLDQIIFFNDVSGNCVGYVTWATVSNDTLKRMLSNPEYVLHLSEWNEGSNPFVMDFMVQNGDVKRYVRESLKLLARHQRAYALRRRPDGSVRKVSTWRPR